MAKLSEHSSSVTTKAILIGDSGSGKTGACASLAASELTLENGKKIKAGYNLRIIDTDAGLDVLANILRHPASPYGSDALDRVDYVTVTDPMRLVGKTMVPSKASVWQRVIKLLETWDNGIAKWTSNDVLILDSLTTLSTAALNFTLAMNGRLGQQPEQRDWGGGQQLIEGLLQMLTDETIKCNVIVISHISFIGEDNGALHGYPATLGKALPPKVGRYFNTILQAKSSGTGTNTKRKIMTNTVGLVELKNSNPYTVKAEYPLSTGLAEYFAAIRSPGTLAATMPPSTELRQEPQTAPNGQ